MTTFDATYREAEAREIARLDGHDILSHSDDWTFFEINDDLRDEKRDATWRTCFSWNDFRFEGFVSDVSRENKTPSLAASLDGAYAEFLRASRANV